MQRRERRIEEGERHSRERLYREVQAGLPVEQEAEREGQGSARERRVHGKPKDGLAGT